MSARENNVCKLFIDYCCDKCDVIVCIYDFMQIFSEFDTTQIDYI